MAKHRHITNRSRAGRETSPNLVQTLESKNMTKILFILFISCFSVSILSGEINTLKFTDNTCTVRLETFKESVLIENKEDLIINIKRNLNCGLSAQEPSYKTDGNGKLILKYNTSSPSGLLAACVCGHDIEFKFLDKFENKISEILIYENGKKVVFKQ